MRGLTGALTGKKPDVRAGGEVERAWQRLERLAPLPMQARAFALALAETMLAGAVTEIFLVSTSGGISALLPLCRVPGFFQRWRMVGAREVFEPGDALYEDEASAAKLAGTIAAQRRPVELDRVPETSLLIPALRAAGARRGWLSLRPSQPCPTLTLGREWENPDSCFNAGRRSDFRRARRRAEEVGELSFETLSPGPDRFDAAFDEAVAVEARSWKSEAGTAMAVDPAKAAFFRRYFGSAAAAGRLRVAFLRIGGAAVAMQLAIEWDDRLWLFKIGHDDAYAKCSPGTLLMLHNVGWAAGRGLRSFEMLGEVEPWILTLWTREQRSCVRLRYYPFNLRGAGAFAHDALSWLRQRLPWRRS